MRDLETGTEWSHILGRAVAGKMTGTQLKPIVSDMLTWAAWRKAHPETTVLGMSRTSKNYSGEIYQHAAEFVFGFEVRGQTYALPMDQLLAKLVHSFSVGDQALVSAVDRQGVVVRLFQANVQGRSLAFQQVDDETMQDDQTNSHWSISRGEALTGPLRGTQLKQRVGIMSFRRAWERFHPDSVDVSF